ncbi:hypothetical protein NDU88_003348 [Pleurodeles waltl]|uniref:Uncharacterized protein n=1 Tax=Pleurodeles waltl TaxID=8319 RepID=A0AAV7UCA5_PLEWA|nr:hypothetical protein NDU88_003348 [Pleurodeles waltl]
MVVRAWSFYRGGMVITYHSFEGCWQRLQISTHFLPPHLCSQGYKLPHWNFIARSRFLCSRKTDCCV